MSKFLQILKEDVLRTEGKWTALKHLNSKGTEVFLQVQDKGIPTGPGQRHSRRSRTKGRACTEDLGCPQAGATPEVQCDITGIQEK